MRHSMLTTASAFALNTFFAFSQAALSLMLAFTLPTTSILYLSLNSSAKCSNSTSSKSRPPRSAIIPLTSFSSMRHSMLTTASAFALNTFFAFSQAALSLMLAFTLPTTSILYLSLNSSAKCSNSTSSKSRPPRSASKPCDSTFIPDASKATTPAWVSEWPTSTKATKVGPPATPRSER
uniref:Uncharacterized protein n=1 Tax=Triticum urartu TaxID=4572 RepID=A0A8R7R972_TRIUA